MPSAFSHSLIKNWLAHRRSLVREFLINSCENTPFTDNCHEEFYVLTVMLGILVKSPNIGPKE